METEKEEKAKIALEKAEIDYCFLFSLGKKNKLLRPEGTEYYRLRQTMLGIRFFEKYEFVHILEYLDS